MVVAVSCHCKLTFGSRWGIFRVLESPNFIPPLLQPHRRPNDQPARPRNQDEKREKNAVDDRTWHEVGSQCAEMPNTEEMQGDVRNQLGRAGPHMIWRLGRVPARLAISLFNPRLVFNSSQLAQSSILRQCLAPARLLPRSNLNKKRKNP